MTARITGALLKPVTDLQSGMAWLDALISDGRAFHLEDDPESVINAKTGEPTFALKDVALLRDRVEDLYAIKDWGVYDCPIGYMLAEEAARGLIDFWTVGDLREYANGLQALVAAVGVGEEGRSKAILRTSYGYMVAQTDKEAYAAGDWVDLFEENEDEFPTLEAAMEAAGGTWRMS